MKEEDRKDDIKIVMFTIERARDLSLLTIASVPTLS
jgi:hypothetical protein